MADRWRYPLHTCERRMIGSAFYTEVDGSASDRGGYCADAKRHKRKVYRETDNWRIKRVIPNGCPNVVFCVREKITLGHNHAVPHQHDIRIVPGNSEP